MNRLLVNILLGSTAFVILLITILVYQVPAPSPIIVSEPTPTIISSPAPTLVIVKIVKTTTPLKDTINQLLKQFVLDYGQKYGQKIIDFKLVSATIVNGEARLVFDDPDQVFSSEMSSRIENTAKQLYSVKSVKITGTIFQP